MQLNKKKLQQRKYLQIYNLKYLLTKNDNKL